MTRSELTQDSAMLVRLRWSFLEGSRVDRGQTSFVADHTGAEEQSVSVIKKMFAPHVLAKLRTLRNQSQQLLKMMTHPYDDNAGRILPTEMFQKFQSQILKIEELLEVEVDHIIDQYEIIKEESRQRLNSLFVESEFPTKEGIRERFGMRVEFAPIPKGDHIQLASLSEEEQEKIRGEIENSVNAKLEEAHKENFRRLLGVMEKLFSRLGNTPEGKPEIFQKSTVENLKEVIGIAKEMNFKKDEKLDSLIDDLKEKLDVDHLDADALRSDKKYRFGVRANLKQSVEDIKALGIIA